jgi:hypothetical protein
MLANRRLEHCTKHNIHSLSPMCCMLHGSASCCWPWLHQRASSGGSVINMYVCAAWQTMHPSTLQANEECHKKNPIKHMYAPHYKDSIANADTASVAHQWLAHGNYLRTSLFADPSGSMQACLLKAPVTGSTLQQGICAGSGAPVSCSPLQQSQMHEAGQLPLGFKLRPLARTTRGPARHWPSLGCLALGGLKGSPSRNLFGQGGQSLFDKSLSIFLTLHRVR